MKKTGAKCSGRISLKLTWRNVDVLVMNEGVHSIMHIVIENAHGVIIEHIMLLAGFEHCTLEKEFGRISVIRNIQ